MGISNEWNFGQCSNFEVVTTIARYTQGGMCVKQIATMNYWILAVSKPNLGPEWLKLRIFLGGSDAQASASLR